MKAILTRKSFIGGATAFGAFGGERAFAVAAGASSGAKPNLRVGVLSDVHIRFDGPTRRMTGFADDKTFIHALEWYRDRGVDAVVIAGDFTDLGLICELEAVAAAWYKVFPGDKVPDGRKVERIFVFGNHEWNVFEPLERYGAKDRSELPQCVISCDPDRHWRRLFGEPFERVFAKTVKGYRFIGAHWMDAPGDKPGGRFDCIGEYLDGHGRELDPGMPFFYVQHPHPKGTVYPFTRFHDGGAATRALSKFPNAVAFSGHSHYSLTDERGIWQGAFTSVGAGCLRWTEPPRDANPPAGYENTWSQFKYKVYDPGKLMRRQWPDWTGRQGLLMDVFDDRIVLARRDFLNDIPLEDDWVVPLPSPGMKPFCHKTRAAKMPAPEFAASAALEVKRIVARTNGPDQDCRKGEEKDALELTIPQASAASGARPVAYEIAAVSKSGRREYLAHLDSGCTHALANKARQVPSKRPIAVDTLPEGDFRFEVTPSGWFGRKGRPLRSKTLNLSKMKK